MDYRQAIDHLLSLVDHERRTVPTGPRQKVIYDLRRMDALLEQLGNPHRAAHTVHVAGTKGKGSTAALCEAALHAAGYRTGFYSSPHLHSFCERIRRDTQPISQPEFAALVAELWSAQQAGLGPVSLFEFMTAMAFQCFARNRVDFQVIEVGLGGRLDATNVVKPDVCVITPVSFDHMAILGDTLDKIAAEKAGIIKPGSTVVIAPQLPEAGEVILAACRERQAIPIQVGQDITWEAGPADLSGQRMVIQGRHGHYPLQIPLLGLHQMENAATAVATLEVLQDQGHNIPAKAIQDGFARVSWPCRIEVLSRNPLVVADGAHNDHSIAALLQSLPRYFDFRRLLLVTGFSRDKSSSKMVRLLAGSASLVYATRSRHPRSLPPSLIASEFRNAGIPATVTNDVADAVALALSEAQPEDLVLGTGSLFVAAEMREKLLGIEAELYPDLVPPDLRGAYPAV